MKMKIFGMLAFAAIAVCFVQVGASQWASPYDDALKGTENLNPLKTIFEERVNQVADDLCIKMFYNKIEQATDRTAPPVLKLVAQIVQSQGFLTELESSIFPLFVDFSRDDLDAAAADQFTGETKLGSFVECVSSPVAAKVVEGLLQEQSMRAGIFSNNILPNVVVLRLYLKPSQQGE